MFAVPEFEEQYLVDAKGEKMAVALPLEQDQRLLKDLHDLAMVAERRDEETVRLEEIKRQLMADGLL